MKPGTGNHGLLTQNCTSALQATNDILVPTRGFLCQQRDAGTGPNSLWPHGPKCSPEFLLPLRLPEEELLRRGRKGILSILEEMCIMHSHRGCVAAVTEVASMGTLIPALGQETAQIMRFSWTLLFRWLSLSDVQRCLHRCLLRC